MEVQMSLLKIAHVPPAAVETGTTVLHAVEVMAEEGVGAVAVLEKGELRDAARGAEVTPGAGVEDRRCDDVAGGDHFQCDNR